MKRRQRPKQRILYKKLETYEDEGVLRKRGELGFTRGEFKSQITRSLRKRIGDIRVGIEG